MPGLRKTRLYRLTDCTTPPTVMIALDEPLPEPFRRVRVDRPRSAGSKAAPSRELGAGGDSGAKRADARGHRQDQVPFDDRRDSRSQWVTAIRALTPVRRCAHAPLCQRTY